MGAENRLCRSGQLGDAAEGLGQRFTNSVDEYIADRHHYRGAASDGLDPRRLDLEITESDVFNENTRSLEILSQLREQGIQISIDDFGTGYSSLSRLSYFPFDKIKIDRSFVINIPEQKDDLDIVRLIISMGKSLHMRIVAEGVETEEQLASLQALGCDLVQGYLIGKPSPLR